jgi:hypothetical protein
MFRKVCQKIILYRLSNIKQLSRYKVDKQKIKALLDKNELALFVNELILFVNE